MKIIQKASVLVGALGVTLVAGLAPATAEEITIRVGSSHSPSTYPITVFKEYFMTTVSERVQKETGNTINWVEAWGGAVCKAGECGTAVRDGLLDIGDIMTIYEPKMMMHGIVWGYVPFSSGDPAVVANAMQTLIDEVPAYTGYPREKNNWEFLTFAPQADYGLITTFTWDNLSDLVGHKIAGASSALEIIQGSGATPVSGSYPEAYTAMQTGVYEGWYLPSTAITPVHLEEVAKQFTIIGAGASAASHYFANGDFWRGLSPEVQAIMKETGREYTKRITARMQQEDKNAIAAMEKAGVRVYKLPEDQRIVWANNLPNIPKARAEEIAALGMPSEVVLRFIQAVKAQGYVFPRDWEAELN